MKQLSKYARKQLDEKTLAAHDAYQARQERAMATGKVRIFREDGGWTIGAYDKNGLCIDSRNCNTYAEAVDWQEDFDRILWEHNNWDIE